LCSFTHQDAWLSIQRAAPVDTSESKNKNKKENQQNKHKMKQTNSESNQKQKKEERTKKNHTAYRFLSASAFS